MYYVAIGWFIVALLVTVAGVMLDGELLRHGRLSISDEVQSGHFWLGVALVAWTATLPVSLTVHLFFSTP